MHVTLDFFDVVMYTCHIVDKVTQAQHMDPQLVVERLGQQISTMRKYRGLTILQLAERAGVTRQKLSEIEKGKLTVSMHLYAKVIAAMGSELTVQPARRPTLEELREVFK